MEGGGKGCTTCVQRNEKWKRGNTVCFICEDTRGIKDEGREVDDEHSRVFYGGCYTN